VLELSVTLTVGLKVSVALTLSDGLSIAVAVLDGLTLSVALTPLISLTVGVTDDVADAELDDDLELDSEAETEGRDDADAVAEVEPEAVRLGGCDAVSVIVLVLVTVAVGDGFCAVRSTMAEVIIAGVPSVPSNVLELPTANTTGVCPDDKIWASVASPLSNKRVQVTVVTPADCEHVTADVPAVECGEMPAKARSSRTYCCAPPPPGSHITALVCGVPIILPDADIPTPNLHRQKSTAGKDDCL
jgi:hypothetical protein